jgi:dienelactone hydrolase
MVSQTRLMLMTLLVSVLVPVLLASVPAPVCAEPAIPSIEQPLSIDGWWVIGPFPRGPREAGTDPLRFFDSAATFSDPLLRTSFPSFLVPGGLAKWRYYPTDENGTLAVDYPEVPEASMELVTDEWGFAGAITVGYAFATLELEEGPRRAIIDLQNAGGFRLNGMPYPGDAYGHRLNITPVILHQGRNTFKIALSRRDGFTLKIRPVEEDIAPLEHCATLPDIVKGEQLDYFIFGLPLVNTTDTWQAVKLELHNANLNLNQYCNAASIAPLGMLNLPVAVRNLDSPLPLDFAEEEYSLSLKLYSHPVEGYLDEASSVARFNTSSNTSEDSALAKEVTLKLRVREADQPRKVTFISSIDRSVQYYGLRMPTDYDPDGSYALILSLHGAGVEAINQVNSYQQKDWAFVASPTNRRRFGFDWQDWGRLDMLEVLDQILQRFPIDEDRIHLTGHSMGGHGTWYNAFTTPDIWATASPSAGWTTFQLYVPQFLRKNVTSGAPRANLLWDLANREENTLVLAENALNLPIYALEGGADDNVPPQQPRMLFDVLERRGYPIRYVEVPGMGHWWARKDTPYTDCVESPAHWKFWQENSRIRYPSEVVFRTHNYSVSDSAYWVQDVVPQRAYDDCVVRAKVVEPDVIHLTTSNVSSLKLDLAPELTSPGRIKLVIDGKMLKTYTSGDQPLHLLNEGEHWTQVYHLFYCSPRKTQEAYGPWKQALMRPFVLVYGTVGTSEQTRWNLRMANLYANAWWYRGNGHTLVMPDTEEAISLAADSWCNLVLLGGPECNAVTAHFIGEMPIVPADDGVHIGDRVVAGKDLTYKFVYPNPMTYNRSLLMIEGGTSLEAMKRLVSVQGVYSGAGFPDWMVWNDEFKRLGLGGVLASGFFDMQWQISDELTFWNEDLMSQCRVGW